VILVASIVSLGQITIQGILIDRWLHIVSGITWIGLLYYFNVVQVPGMAVAAADKGGPGGAGVSKYIAPRALLWFRWAAVSTGSRRLLLVQRLRQPRNLHQGVRPATGLSHHRYRCVARTIMLFNVWALIWPNQKKILGIVTAMTQKSRSSQSGVARLADELRTVPANDHVHGRAGPRPRF